MTSASAGGHSHDEPGEHWATNATAHWLGGDTAAAGDHYMRSFDAQAGGADTAAAGVGISR